MSIPAFDPERLAPERAGHLTDPAAAPGDPTPHQLGGDAVKKPIYEIPVTDPGAPPFGVPGAGGAMPPHHGEPPTQLSGPAPVDYSQLPPPAVAGADGAAPVPATSPPAAMPSPLPAAEHAAGSRFAPPAGVTPPMPQYSAPAPQHPQPAAAQYPSPQPPAAPVAAGSHAAAEPDEPRIPGYTPPPRIDPLAMFSRGAAPAGFTPAPEFQTPVAPALPPAGSTHDGPPAAPLAFLPRAVQDAPVAPPAEAANPPAPAAATAPPAGSLPAPGMPPAPQPTPPALPEIPRIGAAPVPDLGALPPAPHLSAVPMPGALGSALPPTPGAVVAAPDVTPAPFFEDDEDSRAARENADPELIHALHQVLLAGASDLHVSSGAAPLIRIDGGLRPIDGAPVWSRDKVSGALRSILSASQAERFDDELELDFAFTLSGNARFRVNFYQQRGAIGAAFRLIPTDIKPLAQLGVPDIVGEFAKLPRGLVLVTGPTGSGKSTTLAALIDLVNRTRSDHIVTVEDPIEFLHTNKRSLVNQREVGADTQSFANALKHVLRQDPDVILIGKLRDLETISTALTAAETGHLVFATLHTQSAGSTIDRVIDVYPPHQQDQVRTQLANTLQGVVCQTLVKRASGSGRTVATEVMFTTPAIANLIREGKTYQVASMMQAGAQQGMHTMDQALAALVNEGRITRAAAFEKSQDPETLSRLITRVDMDSRPDADPASARRGAR